MNWEVLFDMNGHGAYVWGSFALCVALMVAEISGLRRRIGMARSQADEEPA